VDNLSVSWKSNCAQFDNFEYKHDFIPKFKKLKQLITIKN